MNTHHFIVNLMEVNFDHFVDYVFIFECHERKTCNRENAKVKHYAKLIELNNRYLKS